MADGAYRWLGNAPEPDAGRVAEIDAGWDAAEPHLFAEPARAAALDRIDHALAATRSGDLEEAAARLNQMRIRLAGLDPHRLEPGRGLAGLFDSRGKRLKRFREIWRGAVADLTAIAADLSARIDGSARRSSALDGAWVGIRDAVAELDAHLAVAARRLTRETPEGPHPLEARRAALDACRAAALQSLPLIRIIQNADARAVGTLGPCVEGVAAWAADGQEALGLTGRRPRRVRPDPGRLVRGRDALLTRIDRALAELTTARARRAETEARMTALRASFQD